ncbi:MAG: hypothetical protein LBI13_05845 [Streptococcaceae bacterium]|jgi:hypothetical protein|nr:hypothetical protein [Streptococcaceae bacterium]
MIYLIGEYSVFNRDAAIYGVKKLFDKNDIEAQIITPTMDIKHQRNRAARLSAFEVGTIWSIYDRFTGRYIQEEKLLTPQNFEAPEGFVAQAGFNSLRYINADDSLELKLRGDGSIEAVEHLENGELTQRDNYDDGGRLVTIEYPLGEDTHTKIVDAQGEVVFELYQTGIYKKVVKIKFLPTNQDFLSEEMFWEWAFEQLVTNKFPEDKFFIMNERFRRAIATSNFSKYDVYLLPTEPFNEAQSRDILFDHFEKLIFNSHDELNKIAKHFDEKTTSKLFWNNYIATDKISSNFDVKTFPIYLNLGRESEAVNFQEVLKFVSETLQEEQQVSFVVEFSLLRDQVNFLAGLKALNFTDEIIKERVQAMTRPFPETRSDAIAKSVLYIHYQNPEIISAGLMDAISAEKPILALGGNPLLNDYVNDSNGKIISNASVTRLIKQVLYDVEFIKFVSPNPEAMREKFSEKQTMARWNKIFSDEGRKI